MYLSSDNFQYFKDYMECVNYISQIGLFEKVFLFQITRDCFVNIIFYNHLEEASNYYWKYINFSIMFKNYFNDDIFENSAGTIEVNLDDTDVGVVDILYYNDNKVKYQYPKEGILGTGTRVIGILEYLAYVFKLTSLRLQDLAIIGDCNIYYSLIKLTANIHKSIIENKTWYESLGYEYLENDTKKK